MIKEAKQSTKFSYTYSTDTECFKNLKIYSHFELWSKFINKYNNYKTQTVEAPKQPKNIIYPLISNDGNSRN